MAIIIAALLAFVALVLVSRLGERVRALDDQLKAIHARLRRLEESSGQLNPPILTPPVPASIVTPAAAPSAPLRPQAVVSPTPAAAAAPAPTPQRVAARAEADPIARDLESEIGSRWVLVVGVLVLVLGVAFFVKYAFDRHWISETLRVAAGTLAGAAIWLGGVWLAGRGY